MRPFHLSLLRAARFFIIAALLFAAAPVRAAPISALPEPTDAKLMVMMLAPVRKIYEGDTLTLPYYVTDMAAYGGITLAPLTPPKVKVTAALGSAKVKANGLDGTITYTAQKAGQETITLTHTLPYGTAYGQVIFKVLPKPNYNLEFFIVSRDADASGAGFLGLFSGKGRFVNQPDTKLEGSGNANYWFSLWTSNQAFTCMMNPPVVVSVYFDVSGRPGVAPLIPTPGVPEAFFLDLNFKPVTIPGSTMHCEGLGGLVMDMPFPSATGDANEFGMKDMYFYGEGGSRPVTAAKTSGTIIVTRSGE